MLKVIGQVYHTFYKQLHIVSILFYKYNIKQCKLFGRYFNPSPIYFTGKYFILFLAYAYYKLIEYKLS